MPVTDNFETFKNRLMENLHSVVSPEVLVVDKEFYDADDKFSFLKEFQSIENKTAKRDPRLLTLWMHYCWMRQEISYLAEQRLRQARQSDYLAEVANLAKEEGVDHLPMLMNSVNEVIRMEKLRGTPITDSINVVAKICLQVVGTEHPTDPLQQKARDGLTNLAKAIEAAEPDDAEILTAMREMVLADPIPPFSREVVEEVGRDAQTTLRQFYDILPSFIETIKQAFQTYYPKEYPAHEEQIWQAVANIARDVTWTGGDADNNVNVTPEAMLNSIRIRRIRAAEKHSNTLNMLINKTKQLEVDFRKKIGDLHEKKFVLSQTMQQRLHKDERRANALIDNRTYHDLLAHYQNPAQYTEDEQAEINIMNEELKNHANSLILLSEFSGYYRDGNDEAVITGALQNFQQLLVKFKIDIQLDTTSIAMGSDSKRTNASEYVVNWHQETSQQHATLLKNFPELQQAMRYFGIQLRCYGMSYGATHVRQDSSVYVEVWNTILQDLRRLPEFEGEEVFQLLGDSSYEALTPAARAEVQKMLLNNCFASNKILAEIFRRKDGQIYLNSPEYKDSKAFTKVRSELERIELAVRHSDMFENIIISNTENLANLLEVDSLKRVFSDSTAHLATVPLLEKREDLDHAGFIMEAYIQHRILNALDWETANRLRHDTVAFEEYIQQNKAFLNTIEIEVMFGYSDTERVSGLAALISIQQAQEDFLQLTAKYGVRAKLFHGQGGDLLRGGLQMVKTKMTAQGNMRNLRYGTATLARQFREEQFAVTYRDILQPTQEFAALPVSVRQLLQTFYEKGTAFYEMVHDTETGLGNLMALLFGWGPNWIVNILNSSSRAPQRGGSQNHSDRTSSVQTKGIHPECYVAPGKLRAITVVQINDLLCGYFNIIIGPGRAMRELGVPQIKKLFLFSPTFRDIFEKTAYGIAMTDLAITRVAYFGAETALLPSDPEERKAWAAKAETDLKGFLKKEQIIDLSKKESGREELLSLLSGLFALIEDEYIETANFIFAVNKELHPQYYAANDTFTTGTDLLKHYPQWQAQVTTVLQESMPLSMQLALMNKAVAEGKKLDKVYPALKEAGWENSAISGIAHLIGSVGVGMTAKRYMIYPERDMTDLHPAYVKPANYSNAGFTLLFRQRKEALAETVAGISAAVLARPR